MSSDRHPMIIFYAELTEGKHPVGRPKFSIEGCNQTGKQLPKTDAGLTKRPSVRDVMLETYRHDDEASIYRIVSHCTKDISI